jgi:organic hydroperoxide reductase OsmC/OhrA
MQISATVINSLGQHAVSVRTGDNVQTLPVPSKAAGGSGVNGGEFLMLALATCYCNDLYREAGRMGISLQRVEVEASATFAGVGLAASDVRYRAKVESTASRQAVVRLLRETDAVAEVHNTLRKGVPVQLLG